MVKYKELSHDKFVQCIDYLCNNLNKYLSENNLKVDYICPIVRSGSVPAVYISNKLNIVKFAPMQIKHVSYKDGKESIDIILNSLDCVNLTKERPIFLVVDALQCSGKSAEIAIDAIKEKCNNAIILYVCITKSYGSNDFKNIDYFDYAFQYNENGLSIEECNSLGIDYYAPVFPWEKEEDQINHLDDLEENIYF